MKKLSYRKIRTKKVYEAVADSIINMMKTGHLRPGDRLDSVEKLAEQFGVGRSAVREALNGLRTIGLVEMRQGEGTFVKHFEPESMKFPVTIGLLMRHEDIRELYEVRKILEAGAAKMAAQKYGKEDLEAIEETLFVMEHAAGNERVAEIADANFHFSIVRATHNQILIHLMDSISDLLKETIRETRRVILYNEKRTQELLVQHRRIYEAIKIRDSENAEKFMYRHLDHTQKLLFQIIH